MKKFIFILVTLILTAVVICGFSACEKKEIYGIYVSQAPTKVLYYQGEELDVSGCRIKVRVSDGSDYEVDVTKEMVSGFSSSLGSHTLIITYIKDGVSYITTQKIQVTTHKAVSAEIVTTPSTTFVEGQNIKLDGFKALITFSDGIVAERGISSFTVSPQIAQEGIESVTLTMDAVKLTIPITVVKRELSGIQITRLPYKTEYIEGDSLDLSGLIVKELYNDNSLGLEITDYDFTEGKLKVGVNEITISTKLYGKIRTATFNVTATPLEIIKIELKENSFQKEYILGGTIDYSEIKAEVVTSLNSFTVTSDELVFSIAENQPITELGDIVITVKYKYSNSDTFATINIKVYEEKKLIDLLVYSTPAYSEYTEGDEISYYGLRLYAKYNDKSEEYIYDGDFAELEDLTYTTTVTYGMTSATITFKDKSYSFPITVNRSDDYRKEVVRLYALNEASKKVYYQDEEPDFSGLELYAVLSDGSEELLISGNFILDDPNFSYPISIDGTTFTFTYYNISYSYDITITEE